MATPGLSDKEVKEYKEAFKLFDQNNDGKISQKELMEVMKTLGFAPTSKEVKRMITEVDKNGNDSVEFEEFCVMMKKHKQILDTELEMRQAFKVFDLNGDGVIARDELKAVMERLGEFLSDKELDAMIQAADTNKDGKVCYDEFIRMWRTK